MRHGRETRAAFWALTAFFFLLVSMRTNDFVLLCSRQWCAFSRVNQSMNTLDLHLVRWVYCIPSFDCIVFRRNSMKVELFNKLSTGLYREVLDSPTGQYIQPLVKAVCLAFVDLHELGWVISRTQYCYPPPPSPPPLSPLPLPLPTCFPSKRISYFDLGDPLQPVIVYHTGQRWRGKMREVKPLFIAPIMSHL